ncbi:uncharacterized protein LOC144026642 isoform X2 [Festucalex cinctus]
MCKVTKLRDLVKRKLDVAVEEIFELFEKTIAEYEEEVRRSKEASEQWHREQLDAVSKPRVRLRRGGRHAGKEGEDEASSEEQEEPPAKKRKAMRRTGLRSSQRKKTTADGEHKQEDLQSPPDYLAPISDMDDIDSDSDRDQRVNAKEPLKRNQKLKCSECGDWFANKEDLDRHAKGHTGEKQTPLNSAVVRKPSGAVKSFTCSVCTKSFPSRDILIGHIRAHTEEKQSAAGSSSQQAKTEAGKQRGKDLDSQPARLAPVSDMDDMTADSSDSDHGGDAKKPLEKNKKFKCSECDEMFVHKRDLDKHATTHTGKKPLNIAVATRPSGAVKSFTCSVCKKSFQSRDLLISHIREHTEEKPVTSTRQHVATEGKNLHSEPGKLDPVTKPSGPIKSFTCSVCKKSFVSRDLLISHIREHTKEKPVASTSQHVTTEGKNLHSEPGKLDPVTKPSGDIKSEEEPVACARLRVREGKNLHSEPGKLDPVTKPPSAIKSEEEPVACTSQHVVKEGTSPHSHPDKSSQVMKPTSTVKYFNCPVCKKSFTNGDFLTSHMRVHSEEKPVASTSSSQNVVATENKNLHSQADKSSPVTKPTSTAKSFICSVCKKSFTSSDFLTSHMRVHGEEKPVASTSQQVVSEGKNLHSQQGKSSPATKPSSAVNSFNCSVCKKSFTSSDFLTSHMRVHGEEKPVASTSASQNVVTKGENLHSQQGKSSPVTKPTSTVESFICSVWKKSFTSSDCLTSHMRVHGEEKPVASTSQQVVTEGKNLHSQPGKLAPVKKTAETVKSFNCSFCKKSFASRDFLTTHMRVHTEVKPVASASATPTVVVTEGKKLHAQPDKDDVTSDSSDTDHDANEASETNKKLKCAECGEMFVRQVDLDGHVRTHTEKKAPNSTGVTKLFYTVKSFTCAICMKVFTSNDALLTHVSEHADEKVSTSASSSQPATADVNGKHDLQSEPESLFAPLSYSDITASSGDDPDGNSSVSLATTKTSEGEAQSNKQSKLFACAVCDKSYSRKDHLKRHMMKVHAAGKSKAGEGSQARDDAEKRLNARKKLKRHKRNLKCAHCQKRFSHISHLTQHLAVHSLEKPFACQSCDEKFSFPEAMRMHIQNQH